MFYWWLPVEVAVRLIQAEPMGATAPLAKPVEPEVTVELAVAAAECQTMVAAVERVPVVVVGTAPEQVIAGQQVGQLPVVPVEMVDTQTPEVSVAAVEVIMVAVAAADIQGEAEALTPLVEEVVPLIPTEPTV